MSTPLPALLRLPAVQAFLIQCAAFPLMLLTVMLLVRLGLSMSYLGVALTQGVLAAMLCRWRALAPWWLAIELLFPLTVYGALALQLPPALFLAVFVALLLIFWSTFRTQVPYYPSGARAWDAVAALLPPDRPLRIIDIGSGLGGLVLTLARRRPESTCSGIELAPLPWLYSRLRAALGGSRATFVRGDYTALDFGSFDVIFAYLSPAAMPALWAKAKAEMAPGGMLLSYEFAVPGHPPDDTIAARGAGPVLYVWHF